jgi:hypothetical protein
MEIILNNFESATIKASMLSGFLRRISFAKICRVLGDGDIWPQRLPICD